MKKTLFLLLFFIFSYLISATNKVQIENLKTEFKTNPVGISDLHPRLSWELISKEPNVRQIAWQIRAALSEDELKSGVNLLWNSGEILSDKSLNNIYEGPALKSRDKIFWQVKVFTNKGETTWSKPAFFSMGLLNSSDWKANWIGLDKTFPGDTIAKFSRLSARYLRKEFKTENKTITKATLCISGLGQYEAFVNGYKSGDYVLAPALTDYTKTVKYNTYDITKWIQIASKNVISVVLGNGRFFSTRFEGGGKMRHFGFPKMIAQINIDYQDGSSQIIKSDSSWKINADGPIRSNNEFDGEVYDARKLLAGWMAVGYDDSEWMNAELVSAPEGKSEAQTNPNIRIMDTLKPIKMTRIAPKKYVLDMGYNMVGWLHIRVKGESGDTVKLRFAETLTNKGEIYTKNLRSAAATDIFICSGDGRLESWEPKFVYHGFRYVEVSGLDNFKIDDFSGKIIYDEMETIGTFQCSDTLLNRIYLNAFRGIRGNYRGIPTDCPQRDERQGWLGDRTTGALGESFIFNNHNLYTKWLDDIQLAQKENSSIPDVAPNFWVWSGYTDNFTWPAAYFTVADMLYQQFGDKQIIEKHYGSMKKWLLYMKTKFVKDGIVTKDQYGDWCVPPEKPNLIHSKDSTRITDGLLIGTAFYYKLLTLMGKFANLVEKQEDKIEFTNEAKLVKTAFNKRFFNAEANQYGNNTVTANILPLYFGLIPNEKVEAVFNQMTKRIGEIDKNHISTGIVGIQFLMRGLTAYGRPDLALKLATNRDFPSWGYMVENGATTIWELWNGNTADPAMNSGNHVMLLGDFNIWLYQYLGGIRNSEGSMGYRHIELKPCPVNGLDYVNSSYKSPYGKIVSNWKKVKNKLVWDFTIPCNTSATVYIPTAKGYKKKEFGSGNYHVSSSLK